jgi:hypothetical protein
VAPTGIVKAATIFSQDHILFKAILLFVPIARRYGIAKNLIERWMRDVT